MVLLPFKSPCTVGLYGGTQVGKSTWIERVIEHSDSMFTTPPVWIVYSYGVFDDRYRKLQELKPNMVLYHGVPSESEMEKYTSSGQPGLLILDDVINTVLKDDKAETLFLRSSHHLNFSVMLTSQNLFYQGKCSKSISVNMHYIVLFRMRRDMNQVRVLASKSFPGKVKEFMEVYNDVHKTGYRYLLVDYHPSSDDYILRTHIFPSETPLIYELD